MTTDSELQKLTGSLIQVFEGRNMCVFLLRKVLQKYIFSQASQQTGSVTTLHHDSLLDTGIVTGISPNLFRERVFATFLNFQFLLKIGRNYFGKFFDHIQKHHLRKRRLSVPTFKYYLTPRPPIFNPLLKERNLT